MGNFNVTFCSFFAHNIAALLDLFLTTLTQVQAHLVAAYYRVEYDLLVNAHLVAVPPSHGLSIGVQHVVIMSCVYTLIYLCQYYFLQDIAMEQEGMAVLTCCKISTDILISEIT